MITRFKIYENYIPSAHKDMDQGLYFFLKNKFEGTTYEIMYKYGFEHVNVEHLKFDDNREMWVSINNLEWENVSDGGETNFLIEFHHSDFNIISLEKEIKQSYKSFKLYKNFCETMFPLIEKYKETDSYQEYMMGIEGKKFNL